MNIPTKTVSSLGTCEVPQSGTIESRLRAIAAELDRLIPAGHSVELDVRRYAHPSDIKISVHGLNSYQEATEFMRYLGIGDREKQAYNDELGTRSVLQGDLANGIHVIAFCNGLPPSCRLEETVERIPKTEVVQKDEFIEVRRMKVVCGHEQPALQEASQA